MNAARETTRPISANPLQLPAAGRVEVRIVRAHDAAVRVAQDAFADLRARIAAYEADRPHRLDHPYFSGRGPEELLYDEIEAIWDPIANGDDWAAFHAKLARIETARQAWGLTP